MKLHPIIIGAALAAFTAVSAPAAKLGDPASSLAIKDWIKGKPVDVKDGKGIYVVEFWATWCGPCKTSIPHLTELAQKFKDKGVTFIGISDEDADKVKPFVEKMGAKMDYVVACDDDRKSSERYMTAYGQSGIPTAFIVGKDGKILWFGHPMAELEETLQQVVDGKYDLTTAAKKDAARALATEYQKLSGAGDPKAKALGQELLTAAGKDVSALCDLAFSIAANSGNKNRDFALANEALDLAEKTAEPKNAQVIGTRSVVRFESGQQEEGLKLAKEAVELAKGKNDKARYENYVRVMETRLKQTAKPKKTENAN